MKHFFAIIIPAPSPSTTKINQSFYINRGQTDRSRGIQTFSVSSRKGLTDAATATAAVGRRDGSIQVLNPNTGEIFWRIEPETSSNPNAKNSSNTTTSSTQETSIESIHVCFTGPAAAAASPVVVSCTSGGDARLHCADKNGSSKQLASWKVPATVCATAIEEPRGLFAVGSQGAELRIYSLALPKEPIFSGRGSKPNRVGLVDRPWNSAVAFYPGSEGTKIWTGTGYHKLRLYDTAASKRPQLNVEFGQSRITALAPEVDGNRIWVADATGQIEVYDVRAGRFTGGIKGIAGSVRALAMHPDGKAIASVGLDRFLRVHDTSTRQSLGKVYLKTQLTGVGFCPTDASMAAKPAAAAAERDVSEELEQDEDDAVVVEAKGRKNENGGGGKERKQRRSGEEENARGEERLKKKKISGRR